MRTQELPLISCLMITRGTLFPARFAVECFRRQTYANRELVIICDAPNTELAGHVAKLRDPSIRFIEVEKSVLGRLRNQSARAAKGALFAQWDDDDLHHPDRLARQMRILSRNGAEAHFLSRWTLWWPRRRLLGISDERAWEGSMLIRREAMVEYPELSRAEDTVFMRDLKNRSKLIASEQPELYCYVVHGGNTWEEGHFERMFGRAQVIHADYEAALARVAKEMPLREYAEALDRSRGARKYERERFGAQTVKIDAAAFSACSFAGTTLQYEGGDTPSFGDCTFEDVRVQLSGPAKTTFETLHFFARAGVITIP